MCFQRDSRKDQIIVWCFLLGTGCLLGWTAVQRLMKLWETDKTSDGRGANGREGGPFQRFAARSGLGSERSTSAGRAANTTPQGQYVPLNGNSRG